MIKTLILKKQKREVININEVKKIIDVAIRKCKKIIPSPSTRIFVFPSYSSFTKNKMGGSSGYTPWQNTMILFIDPTCKQWRKNLETTVIHEYAHTVSLSYHKWETLLDSIVFEGLAENFVKDVLTNKLSPWSRSLNLQQSKACLRKIKSKLDSEDISVYRSVFFGDKKYPLWAGYSIEYNVVKNFLDKQYTYCWEQIIKKNTKAIMKKSGLI